MHHDFVLPSVCHFNVWMWLRVAWRYGYNMLVGQVVVVPAIALLSFLSVVGCNSRDYELAPVSGVVTLDGKPLCDALVVTQPIAREGTLNPGPGSFGKTNAQGKFSLELVHPAEPGAVVGQHRVRINKVTAVYRPGREDAPISIRNPLPRSATDGSQNLTVPVDGTDQVRFDLKSKL